MPEIHLHMFFATLIGRACWLDLLIRGCHTLLARMSLVILPLGMAIYLIVPMDVRHSSEADRVMFSIMCGIGVGGCLANKASPRASCSRLMLIGFDRVMIHRNSQIIPYS